MKLSVFLLASAVVYAIFGLALVLVPGLVLPIYGGMSMEPYVEQLLGAQLIGFAVLNMFARKATEGEALRAILLANLVSDIVAFILALLEVVFGGENVVGWSTVVIYLILGLGSGYFLLIKRMPSAAGVAQAPRRT